MSSYSGLFFNDLDIDGKTKKSNIETPFKNVMDPTSIYSGFKNMSNIEKAEYLLFLKDKQAQKIKTIDVPLTLEQLAIITFNLVGDSEDVYLNLIPNEKDNLKQHIYKHSHIIRHEYNAVLRKNFLIQYPKKEPMSTDFLVEQIKMVLKVLVKNSSYDFKAGAETSIEIIKLIIERDFKKIDDIIKESKEIFY